MSLERPSNAAELAMARQLPHAIGTVRRPAKRLRSLRTRLVLLVALLLVSVALFLLIYLPDRIESRSRGLVEGRAIGIATLLAKATAPALEFDDEASASERLAQMASTPDAIYAQVSHADGTPLAVWRADTARTTPIASHHEPGVTLDASILDVVIPISTKGGTKGSLSVGFTLEGLERERQAAFRLVAITSTIVLVVGLGVAFVIGTLLIRPIERMTQLALKISEGEHPDPDALDTARSDEVGTMARAFELMLDGITRHRSFLECQSEASADGILIVSNNHEVLSYNRRFAQVWQFENDELPTWDASQLLQHVSRQTADPKKFYDGVGYLDAHIDEELQDEIQLTDGRVYDCHSAPIKSSDGTHFGRGWYFREITDRKRAQDEIRALNADLEQRVDERTRALELANHELAARFKQLNEAQRQLLEASRKSGMADVATAVLHNVGNVLNSVNVSANLVVEAHRTSRIQGLRRVVDLISSNRPNLGDFFTSDPRGSKLPSYFEALVQTLDAEREVLTRELTSLQKNVDHIRVIVSRQQANAKQGGMLERVALESLIDDAVAVITAGHDRPNVVIERDYVPTKLLTCDRHKAFQIVMNFLANAQEAVEANVEGDRRIAVRTRMNGDEAVVLEVHDNGTGIAPENLGKIFNHGFTTKPTGHGFGLHSSACCALEMGGAVAVESAGMGKGACFRLTMPLVARNTSFDHAQNASWARERI